MGLMTELFASDVYARRLDTAAQLCQAKGLAGLIIGTGAELAYLTGSWLESHERLTALIVPAQGRALLIAPETDIADLSASAVPDLPIDVHGWADGDDAHQLAVAHLATGGTVTGQVGLGESLTTNHVLRIQERLAQVGDPQTILAATALKELFMRKDADEVEQLRRAGAAIDAVHAQVPGLLRPGRTEAEVAADIEKLILADHDVVDFIIVGSGPNGANPHHSFSERTLNPGELVVVDIGGTYGVGYHSDCTRTYVVGGDADALDEKARAMYDVLFSAQAAAVKAVRPGVTAQQIDAVARDAIAEAGFGDAFFHRTGHGIGLSTHEEPFIMAGNDLVLEEGMAFSIEPGIYLRGQYGARIEDIVVVTAQGCEQLNTNTRELS